MLGLLLCSVRFRFSDAQVFKIFVLALAIGLFIMIYYSHFASCYLGFAPLQIGPTRLSEGAMALQSYEKVESPLNHYG